MTTRISINKHVIAKNLKHGTDDPPIAVRQGSKTTYAHDVRVGAGLLEIRRVGLGRPNEYLLLGIPDEDLDGRASGRPATGQQEDRPRYTKPDSLYSLKETGKKSGILRPRTSGFLETRYGTYVPR